MRRTNGTYILNLIANRCEMQTTCVSSHPKPERCVRTVRFSPFVAVVTEIISDSNCVHAWISNIQPLDGDPKGRLPYYVRGMKVKRRELRQHVT